MKEKNTRKREKKLTTVIVLFTEHDLERAELFNDLDLSNYENAVEYCTAAKDLDLYFEIKCTSAYLCLEDTEEAEKDIVNIQANMVPEEIRLSLSFMSTAYAILNAAVYIIKDNRICPFALYKDKVSAICGNDEVTKIK